MGDEACDGHIMEYTEDVCFLTHIRDLQEELI